jgi:ribosomal protein L37AE/L43A
MRAWLVLLYGARTEDGRASYDDDPEEQYAYDSKVANSSRVAEGDVLVVIGRGRTLGWGVVKEIDKEKEGWKTRLRCPRCRRPKAKLRTTVAPRFRCKECGHEFDDPVYEKVACTKFKAHYEGTFRPVLEAVSPATLRGMVLSSTDYMSIRELDLERLRPLLPGLPG